MTVLDASAVLAAILDEPGGDLVFDRLGAAAVSAVNVAEVYTYAAINGLSFAAIDAFFEESGCDIEVFDLEQASLAGKLAALTRKAGLSLGDRACLALAKMRGTEVLTADRSWQTIAEATEVKIQLLR